MDSLPFDTLLIIDKPQKISSRARAGTRDRGRGDPLGRSMGGPRGGGGPRGRGH
ncbi:hypothetical protein KIN20_026481 [Parelaphostrongylus tenuis]|uniref:Uncharacterized protein n=1 Tax=Parelaphostrongylus tenuis TaxID=148309 RepID=A0AAD5QY42_PARTN|nr:hypothetical protein KIN20_026481 [Parelaphostrongylus tenuis]